MTEKQYAPTKTEKKVTQQKVATPKMDTKAPVQKENKQLETKSVENKKPEEVKQEKKAEVKKPVKKVKKEEVAVNAQSVPISTKYSMALCKFVKHKPIEKAIADLEQVLLLKKAVPMKGEIPHRKGKIMSGRFPKKATEHFIMLLKSLLGNANNHDVDEPIITFAMANMASRPIGRFGRMKKKRTHIIIRAKSKKLNKKEKKKTEKKK